MKSVAADCIWFSLLFPCVVSNVAENNDGATPVTKVVKMLHAMIVKGVEEKNAEEVAFVAFKQWSDGQRRVKAEDVQASDDAIEALSAKIQKTQTRIRSLTERVQELEEDMGRWKKDQSSASAVRQRETADYQATAQDYSETLDALDRATGVLQKQQVDRPQVEEALLQVKTKTLVPAASKHAVTAFLQGMQPEELSYDAPEANAYESHSGGIVDMLGKLRDEFLTKKTELDIEERNAQHAFDQIMQQLHDNTENAQHEVNKKTVSKEETAQAKAEAEGSLAQAKADRAADAEYLEEMNEMCRLKSQEYEDRQKLRAGEIQALKKAQEIISGGAVAGAAEKHLPTLLQIRQRQSNSLAQLRSVTASPLQERLAVFLRERASSCNSQLLSLVSQHVATDPFTTVKKMIKDLISKLVQEATAETEHKGWCDTELVTNKQTRDSTTEEVSQLSADVEDLTAEIARLGQDLTDLAVAIAENNEASAKASADRQASKATNTQTMEEAKQAQVAVTQAIAVLKDYYAKAAEATSLEQEPAVDAPATWDNSYNGKATEGGSVIDFLEVILSDFARLEAETSTTENAEQDEFEKFEFESRKDLALKQNEVEHKQNKMTDKESALHSTQGELRASQEQLNKAAAYFEKLKPTCVDSGITYEERVKRREAEMQSLQEALNILTGSQLA